MLPRSHNLCNKLHVALPSCGLLSIPEKFVVGIKIFQTRRCIFENLIRLIILEAVNGRVICITCDALMQMLAILFLINTFIIVGITCQIPSNCLI